MDFLEIIEITGRTDAGSGVLEPFICRCSDGKTYYVKGKYAGYESCIRELVAAKLGRLLNINIPPFALVTFPPEISTESSLFEKEIGKAPAFASCEVENATRFQMTSHSGDLTAKELDILFFDWWIRNDDRTKDNPNLLFANGEIHVIDHNLAFINNDSLSSFIPKHVLGQSWDLLKFEREKREPLLDEIMSTYWRQIVSDIPSEWLEAISSQEKIIEDMETILMRYKNEPDAFWFGGNI